MPAFSGLLCWPGSAREGLEERRKEKMCPCGLLATGAHLFAAGPMGGGEVRRSRGAAGEDGERSAELLEWGAGERVLLGQGRSLAEERLDLAG